jgi:hypothetical protein
VRTQQIDLNQNKGRFWEKVNKKVEDFKIKRYILSEESVKIKSNSLGNG